MTVILEEALVKTQFSTMLIRTCLSDMWSEELNVLQQLNAGLEKEAYICKCIYFSDSAQKQTCIELTCRKSSESFFGGKRLFRLKYIFHMRHLFSLRHCNFLWEGCEVWKEILQGLLLLQTGTNWFWFFVLKFLNTILKFSAKRSNVRHLLSFIFKWIFLLVSGSQKHETDDSGIKKRTCS